MKKTIISAVSLIALCVFSHQAVAAGFHLSEYTVTGMGRSFAGTGVVGDDFSALAFNPAGMQYNKTSGFQAGASVVSLHFDYKGSIDTAASVGANGVTPGPRYGAGHTRPSRVLPHVFAQQKVNDKTTIGLGAYAAYGLATDYENDWFAESHGGLSQLSATNVSPSVSYQLTDKVALGGAVNIQYITARLAGALEQDGMFLESGRSNVQGDDYGVGYTLGATYTPRKDIRLGISYRSKISHELRGDLKTSGLSAMGIPDMKYDVKAKVTTPEVLLLSAAYDLNKCFTISGTARWTHWSRFKNLDIVERHSGMPMSQTFENWKNTWYYAIGLDYRYNRNWGFRTGLGYDETVIKSPEFRTARIPDGRRILASLGTSYKYKNWQFDAGYTHIFAHGGEVNGGVTGYSKAHMKYSADAEMFSLGFQYKF